jgi:Zn-dependent protease with chaperone function
VQWTRSRDGLGGVLRKALTQRQEADTMPADPAWPGSVKHLLLAGHDADGGWFATHPPLAQRIERIYGRPMPALPLPVEAQPSPFTSA